MNCFVELGWELVRFQPKLSVFADLEAHLAGFADVDLVWVPCFRQRDVAAASRWARGKKIPIVFDPLISAFDKQVYERQKFAAKSAKGKRLLRWEQDCFARADWLIADTQEHAAYFYRQHGFPLERICVLPVSAEEGLFSRQRKPANEVPQALFFGTFIGLQGATYIAEAAALYRGPACRLTFLGTGPDRAVCEAIMRRTNNPLIHVAFEEWVPLQELPARIAGADVCLGVFGVGEKTNRVIPNKVYQALACDRPVITMQAEAYPQALREDNAGLLWVPPGDPAAIAKRLAEAFSGEPLGGAAPGVAYAAYATHFSNQKIRQELSGLLQRLL
ncbi:MAG: glycosyltransferase [Proteobacteria bacterium]|nr:glycosyltransferase [Pseudomonadota bacterium]